MKILLRRTYLTLAIYTLSFSLFVGNSLGDPPSPISDRVLTISQLNSQATGTASNFPTASESRTVEAYVFFPSFLSSLDEFVIEKKDLFQIRVCQDGLNSSLWKLDFLVRINGSDNDLEGVSFQFLPFTIRDRWHHIAGVYDESLNEVRVYLNGSRLTPNGIIAINYPNPQPTHVFVGGRSFRTFFVDELRVSRDARYNSDFLPPTMPFSVDSSTSALWHFDEPICTASFTDNSGNGNTLVGEHCALVRAANSSSCEPVASDDIANTSKTQPIFITNVLENDVDPNGINIAISGAVPFSAENATITRNENTITYDPTSSSTLAALADGESIVDTFSYTIVNSNGCTDSAIVSITVVGSNNPSCVNYVDVNTPNGQGDGSLENPFRTVNEGIMDICEGGKVIIREGNYTETIIVDKKMTLTSEGGIARIIGTLP